MVSAQTAWNKYKRGHYMTRKIPNKTMQSGFSIVGVVLIIVAVAAIGFGGWYVWQAQQAKKVANTTKPQSTIAKTEAPKAADPYEGWRDFSNSAYGISFKYPPDWVVEEGASGSSSSATRQEYFINLKRNVEVKYNQTVVIEVLGQNLMDSTKWYEESFAKPTKYEKKNIDLKGKQSVQFLPKDDIDKNGRYYLFSINDKTYVFNSVNEELNQQQTTNYWADFDNVFNTLTIK